jgi:short-subunit dehydrogenase
MGTSPPKNGYAIVTGASSGIGFELAKCCAAAGYDLLICADLPAIHAAASLISQSSSVRVEALQADLSTMHGVEHLYRATRGRPVDALLANAGVGLGHAFLDQRWPDVQAMIDTNVTGTLALIHMVGRDMRARGAGKILITGSIAGLMPGTYNAVYNGTKALLDSFSYALRAELMGSGVTVTCLMPGATETDFFERADMMDTKAGVSKKQSPDEVARIGYAAMVRGDGHVVAGWHNKLLAAMARFATPGMLAEQYREIAEPGSAGKI